MLLAIPHITRFPGSEKPLTGTENHISGSVIRSMRERVEVPNVFVSFFRC
jgi:hypothetical protein